MMIEQQNRLQRGFEAEHTGLLAFIRSRIRSLEESEDLLQDVFVQAMGSLNVLENVDNLTGWLYTVTKNKIIDWYRRRKLPVISIEESQENGVHFADILANEMPEALDDETRELIIREMTSAIDELPEKQRFVFIQQVVEDRTFRDLAQETGESINTLLARKRYALQFLQGRLREIKELLYEK
jgi:RNA polymerase sigma factor (sigma-70 family)